MSWCLLCLLIFYTPFSGLGEEIPPEGTFENCATVTIFIFISFHCWLLLKEILCIIFLENLSSIWFFLLLIALFECRLNSLYTQKRVANTSRTNPASKIPKVIHTKTSLPFTMGTKGSKCSQSIVVGLFLS